MQIPLRWTWDGQPLRPAAQLHYQLTWTRDHLMVEVEAPYYQDPPPPNPPGSCDGLWEFEVAELFLVGHAERYVELELRQDLIRSDRQAQQVARRVWSSICKAGL